MPVDADAAKALRFEPRTIDVERGALRFFNKVIGQSDPAYTDIDAARALGHPDLLVPPTYFFSLGLQSTDDQLGFLTTLGVDLRRILHGEQSFDYHRLAYAGDALTLQDRIEDVYAKQGGALEFILHVTDVVRAGEPIATARGVIIVRHPEAP